MKRQSICKLYIDDLRPLPRGWKLARTNSEAIDILSSGKVREVSIDHDIMPIGYTSQDDETFMPTARFIAAMPPSKHPKMVTIHTSSPTGAARMAKLFREAGIPCRRAGQDPE